MSNPRAALLLTLAFIFLSTIAGCAHRGAAVLVHSGGRFEFQNLAAEPVEVFIEGSRVALVEPGKTAKLDRLPVGDSTATLVGRLTGFRESRRFVLSRETETHWRYSPDEDHARALSSLPSGGLKAVNHAREPVRIKIDGDPREMIWPGGEAEYTGIAVGRHRLEAVGIKSGFTLDSEVVVGQSVQPVFVVVPPRCGLRVENRSGVSLRVSVGDETDVSLRPDGFQVLKGLSVGDVPIVATDLLGRTVWSGIVLLQEGQVTALQIPLPQGVLAVVSDVPEELTILADGRRLGACLANGAAEFRGLVPGAGRVQALRSDGTVIARARLVVPREGQGVWMIKPGFGSETAADEGSLLVLNQRDEPIRLRVDGWNRGEIVPSGRRLIPALVPGPHSADAIGMRTGELLRSVVTIGIGEHVTWEARPSVATLNLKNEREEEVRVLLDDLELILLAPAEEAELKVVAGRHHLQARGLSTLRATDHAVDLPASTRSHLALPSPSGSLVVTNRFSEPLSIKYSNRDLGVVLPGDKVTFRDMEPGSHDLMARSLKRPLSWGISITLAAGETFEWELKN